MARSISAFFDGLTRALVYALVFLLPLFLLPSALDPLELNKQTLLVTLTLCAFLAWCVSMVASRRFAFRRGWINVVPLFVLVATVASAVRSPAPYLSWIGGSNQEYMSVLTMLALTLLYFVVVNRFADEREHRVLHGILLASAAIAGGIGICFALTGSTFNTVGTFNALVVYLVAIAVFGCGAWVASRPDHALLHGGALGRLERALVFVVAAEAVAVLLIAGYDVLWVLLLAGLVVQVGFFFLRARDINDVRRFVLPLALLVVSVLALLRLVPAFPSVLPLEVTPSFPASERIARQALDGPSGLFGSGPGTYQFDYALYHDADVNATSLWAERFDRGASFVMTVAPGLGIVGGVAWGLFFLLFALRGIGRVAAAKGYREWAAVLVDVSGWTVFAIAAFLYSGNMTTVFFIYLFAALIASRLSEREVEGSFERSPKVGYLFSASVVLLSVAVMTVVFVGVQRYRSEMALARAAELTAEGGESRDIVVELDRAATYNRFNDVAYRYLAQELVRRVDEEVGGMADGAASADARDYLRALTAASVNAAVRATELSPRNALNWLSRGAVYRAFVELVGNAGDYAVSSYERAAALEPLNPDIRVELGKTYLALAESVRDLTGSDDASVAADAQARLDAYLADAEAAFEAAAALKPDYAPAHYQLAVTYDRQGRLDDAVGKMESVARYNQNDVGVAFQLGLLYMRRASDGDLERAQAALEHAVELAPAYANARWFLATVYEQKGDLAAAVGQIESVLQYNADNALVRQRLERLRAGVSSGALPEVIE